MKARMQRDYTECEISRSNISLFVATEIIKFRNYNCTDIYKNVDIFLQSVFIRELRSAPREMSWNMVFMKNIKIVSVCEVILLSYIFVNNKNNVN